MDWDIRSNFILTRFKWVEDKFCMDILYYTQSPPTPPHPTPLKLNSAPQGLHKGYKSSSLPVAPNFGANSTAWCILLKDVLQKKKEYCFNSTNSHRNLSANCWKIYTSHFLKNTPPKQLKWCLWNFISTVIHKWKRRQQLTDIIQNSFPQQPQTF